MASCVGAVRAEVVLFEAQGDDCDDRNGRGFMGDVGSRRTMGVAQRLQSHAPGTRFGLRPGLKDGACCRPLLSLSLHGARSCIVTMYPTAQVLPPPWHVLEGMQGRRKGRTCTGGAREAATAAQRRAARPGLRWCRRSQRCERARHCYFA